MMRNKADLLSAQRFLSLYTNEERRPVQKQRVGDRFPRKPMPHSRLPTFRPEPRLRSPAGETEIAAQLALPEHAVSSHLDETDLLVRAQAGDHLAYAQLYSLHKRRIFSLCLRMVGDAAEAEDLTQEAFLQLHRKIATFRGDSAFSTWLHRLAINIVLMHLRKRGVSLVSMDEDMEPAPEKSLAQGSGVLDLTLTGSIDRLALERAVGDLPAGYCLVFVLHDIEGYEHEEIAAMLDCSVGNSKSQLHKARLKLRDALRTFPRQEARR
jgi:RNA polymerase sigma-70 factor (ECF subfamily)